MAVADQNYEKYVAWCNQGNCDHSTRPTPPLDVSSTIDESEAKKVVTDLAFNDIPNRPGQQHLKSSGHVLHVQYDGKYYGIVVLGVVVP